MARWRFLGGVSLLVVLATGLSVVEAVGYDLAADWSDATNPFGPWSLKKSPTALFTTNLPDYFANGSNQAAWADGTSGALAHVPLWMKNQSTEMISAHSPEFDRTGTDYTAVMWTSPLSGTVQVDGALWSTWLSGRHVRWLLKVNGSTVSQGDIIANGTYTDVSPFDLVAGSGGAGVLTQTVGVGDEIELGLQSISDSGNLGDTLGLRLAITPEPGTLALLGLGALRLRRKRQ